MRRFILLISLLFLVFFSFSGGYRKGYSSFHVRPLSYDFRSGHQADLKLQFYFNYLRDSTASTLPLLLIPEDNRLVIEEANTTLEFDNSFRTIHTFPIKTTKTWVEKDYNIEVLHAETNQLLAQFHITVKPPKFLWIRIALYAALALVFSFGIIYYFLNKKT